MKDYIAIVKSTAGKLDKYQDFDSRAEADAHVLKFGGFVVPNPGGDPAYWIINEGTKTVVNDQVRADVDAVKRDWLAQMAATDAAMPRWFEDYIDENAIVLVAGRVKDSYDAKKVLRSQEPDA